MAGFGGGLPPFLAPTLQGPYHPIPSTRPGGFSWPTPFGPGDLKNPDHKRQPDPPVAGSYSDPFPYPSTAPNPMPPLPPGGGVPMPLRGGPPPLTGPQMPPPGVGAPGVLGHAVAPPPAGAPTGAPSPGGPPSPYSATPPQYQAPDFSPAQYHAPQKGLEYLALGLGILFPGAPIARLAAGFSQGLGQGSQDRYQRDETQAEQQYKVAQNQAQGDFENQKILWDQGEVMRARGLNPLVRNPDGSYAEFQYPTMTSLGGGKDYAGTVGALGKLIQMAQHNGDTASAQLYGTQLQSAQAIYQKQVQWGMQMRLAIFSQSQQNDRNDKRIAGENLRTGAEISAANSRTGAEISAANARSVYTQNSEDARLGESEQFQIGMLGLRNRAKLNDPVRLQQLQDAALRLTNSFNSQLFKETHTTQTTVTGPNGQPKVIDTPAQIPSDLQHYLTTAFNQIRGSSNPSATAAQLKMGITNQEPGQVPAMALLDQYADTMTARMRAQGREPGGAVQLYDFSASNLVPAMLRQAGMSGLPIGSAGTQRSIMSQALTWGKALKAAGINTTDPKVLEQVNQAIDNGVNLQNTIQHLKPGGRSSGNPWVNAMHTVEDFIRQ